MAGSESELTDLIYDELEEEESDYEKTARTTSSPRKQPTTLISEYKIQKVLKPPRATTYTACALYDQMYSSDIDLSPEYQRDVVWTKDKQIGLIDSIFRNYYIPPIIFSVSIAYDGLEHRTCLDGKQRLTSIQLFMDGLIPHRAPITGQKYWYTIAETGENKQNKQLLPSSLRNMFANKQIVCVEYTELSDLDERDIFKRVQQGMALKPSEKLSVLSTPRTVFIRDLLRSYVTENTLGAIPWETTRNGDFRCFSHVVYCIERWSSDPEEVKDQGTLVKMEKMLAGPDDIDEDLKEQIRETYDIFAKLATTPKYSAPFKEYKKVSPAEMIFIPLLIFVHGVLPPQTLRYTRRELCTEIMNMRHSVRQSHDDVRMNTRVGKFLANYIRKMKEKEPEQVRPAKIQRKRIFKEEEDEIPLSTGSSRRKLLTPDTPTVPSADIKMATLSGHSSTASVMMQRKKISSITDGFTAPPQPPTSSSVAQRTSQVSFQSRTPLSPASSGSGSADRDIGRGPLNKRVTLNSDSDDVHMINGTSR